MDTKIKHISKILKTDLTYILKGSGSMVTGQGLSMVITLGSSVAFANLLPKDAFGVYQYILTVAEFIMAISLTAISTSVIRSVARGYEGTLAYTFRENLRWSSGSVLLGLAIAGYYFFKDNSVLGAGIILAALLTPLITSAKLYISHLIGKKLFARSASLTVIGSLVPTLVIIAVLFFTNNILLLALTYFITHTAINLFLHKRVLLTATNHNIDPETIPYAKHLSYQNAIVKIAGYLDKLLLFQLGGSISLAEYLFAISVPRQFQFFFKSAKTIVLPKVSTRSFDDLRASLPRKILLLYIFVIPAMVLYVLCAPTIFKIVFPQYIDAVSYSQVYAIIFLLLPLTILTDVFTGLGEQKILYKISVFNSMVKIITTAVFVPLYGTWGVLMSLLLTEFLNYAQVVFYFLKRPRDHTNTPHHTTHG